MKKLLLAVATFATIFSTASAQNSDVNTLNEKQVSQLDVSGKWVGKRFQYTADHKNVLQTFEYEFDLKQNGDIVTGTTSISGENGIFGDMKMRGVISGNKLIFEEYEIVSENILNEGKTWCYKVGELSFAKDGGQVALLGETPSYMPYYGFPCTGGFSNMKKVDSGSEAIDFSNFASSKLNEGGFSMNVQPNPFVSKATINFNLDKDAKVELSVMDLSGKTVATLQNGKLEKGNHEFIFDVQKNTVAAANYIAVLKVNGETHSSLITKANY
ncbi:MAG: T9SS type A sorting domain-containing protein [Chitinophagales bacterium]|nr:T9SS type A sorting domain-containing protein [Chitinophagales bacterium]OJV25559.1 MAG: hypothetical protein BGO32_00675 [Bacteroidetes bacterium 37-13]HRN95025.1 T9SS type A sorting domain-containing protein [Chitinophagales bacterium]HRP38150.1 T9SS type A sorting domain-containing protein [Chitinophagales bacterium]